MRELTFEEFGNLPAGTVGYDPHAQALIISTGPDTEGGVGIMTKYLNERFHYTAAVGELSETTGTSKVFAYDEREARTLEHLFNAAKVFRAGGDELRQFLADARPLPRD